VLCDRDASSGVIREEWRQSAERDGQASILTHILAHHFGDLPPEAIERIQHAPSDTLLRWAERMLTAQSLDDVFA
jgi:hypothetical protein